MQKICAFILVLGALSVQAAGAAIIPRDVSLAPVVEQVSPAVVNISTRGTTTVRQSPMFDDPFFRRFFGVPEGEIERPTTSLGSGVIVDAKEGYIITNNHVIANADEITVNLTDGRELSAEVVGSDELVDVAVLKVDAGDLTDLKFGSSDQLRQGDYVLAIGNPFGLGGTVTSGIVSALGRSGLSIQGFEDFIQTDAAINRGNSGGALINLQGELVGINTAIIGSGPGGGNVGIGFAIPSRMVQLVMDQILEYGEVRRGQLGVYGQNLTPLLAEELKLDVSRGAVVTRVVPNTAAANAGLREYDVITQANGRKVSDFQDLRNIVGLMRPGSEVDLEVYRDGKRRTVTAELKPVDQSLAATSNGPTDLRGATLAAMGESHPLFGEVEGVVVSAVESDSAAARADLRAGDVIVGVNRRPVRTMDDIQPFLETEGRLLLNVRRQEGSFFSVLR